MSNKAWKIIPRPLLETILNNHASQHRVPQLLFLHGPRGVGKTTLILDRLFEGWNKGPHVTGYVDFGRSVQDRQSSPWVSWSSTSPIPPSLTSVCLQLEHCLEEMVEKGVRLGRIGSNEVFATLNRWHDLNTALRRILQNHATIKTVDKRFKASSSALSKKVIEVHQSWRANAIADLNRIGGYSRSLVHSCTDWPYLLVELLSVTAETDYFQTFGWTPKEAKMHLVTDYFSESEDHAGHQREYFRRHSRGIISISSSWKNLLRFVAPWRHPPRTTNPTLRSEWAKIQLLDFVQSLVNAEFGINYFTDRRLEFLEDPCATAMMEVGLLYKQRDPPYIRPVFRGIQRCLVRWLVQERMQMNFWQSLKYRWQRVIRGRSYRHLMREVGYK
ncbi:hypothetical protein GIB67_030488 [Kingdonia uniflora]|uniref:Uncharacterized protein n=1 Tax=Kingdonia uniflora TaxID=39325 RepID=A0A7J7P7D8_9MAGN|nr:hypothetical protein GIB67_030488 [Kingdonia uniflora]